MKSALRKLIPSLVMVLITAAMVGTSTFAWFSMNNKVTVTGMTVTTKVGDSLLIASTEVGNNKVADSAFKNALDQTVSGQLQPSSTISALPTAFYWSDDAAADGHKQESTSVVPYTLVENNTITVQTVDYQAYVDYVFEIKAMNAGDSDKKLNLSRLNLLYSGGTANVTNAFRVAIFSQAETNPNPATPVAADAVNNLYKAISTTTADAIFATSEFSYFTVNKAVTSTTELAAVAPGVNSAKWSKTVNAGKTAFYKVTVRLWLEGEDKDCYNTKFVDLTSAWTLDLAFTLDLNDDAAVQAIGSAASFTAVTATGNTANTTLSEGANMTNGEKVASFQWKNAKTNANLGSANATSYTNDTGDALAVYLEVTTVKGNKYRSNTVTLTA